MNNATKGQPGCPLRGIKSDQQPRGTSPAHASIRFVEFKA
jgi:hypothetical protein